MGKLIDSLTAGIRNFLRFIFSHFYAMAKELWMAKKDIPFRYLMADFIAVLRSAGMFTFFNFVALVVFTLLPQGKDILLIIAEDILHFQLGNLFCLLIGIVFWSIASEYGTRYAIYVTDNSGNSLSDKRILWRKAVQRAMADIFLMLPYLIVLLGFVINYLQDTSLSEQEKRWGFGVPALCLYIVFSMVAKFYFTGKRSQWRKEPNAFQRFMLLPDREREWCNKLLGIYNRYVFSIRKPTNFSASIRDPFQKFCDNFLAVSKEEREKFPQDPSKIDAGSLVPAEFQFEEFTENSKDDQPDNLEGNYKWVYSIPFSFYKTLHRQLLTIFLFSLILFGIICLLPIRYYGLLGAPGLVVIAFGCWSGLYAGLLYMDYAVLRSYKVSLRFVLFLCLIFSSFFNNDHPVRYNENGNIGEHRPTLPEHFRKWFDQYRKDSLNSLYLLKSDSVKTPFYPVVFVCAEGGALRTGAFAAQTLSFLQDSIAKHYKIDVKNSVYAYSGVSGGGLGISFFNAIAYLSADKDLKQDTSLSSLTKIFFNEDYLAPVIGKMFYADVINLFIPFTVQRFDRAIVLEKAWEQGFEKVIKPDSRNIFSSDVRSLYTNNTRVYPALFINTTEAETGRQCWLSNVRPDTANMLFADKRDLLAYKVRGGINYSTMTNFSSRFPLFSPGAAVIQDEGKKFHYIDGGYVENTGTGTMLEVLQALEPVFDSLEKENPDQPFLIKPFVFILQYNQYNNGHPDNINFANEFTEVGLGIYNTRNGRSTTALEQIQRYVRKMNGESFILPLQKSGSEVPMNWVLSKKSLQKIEEDIKEKWAQRDVGALRKFFAIDTVNNKRWHEARNQGNVIMAPAVRDTVAAK